MCKLSEEGARLGVRPQQRVLQVRLASGAATFVEFQASGVLQQWNKGSTACNGNHASTSTCYAPEARLPVCPASNMLLSDGSPLEWLEAQPERVVDAGRSIKSC